jgi:replicative DNA helicase
MIHDSLANERNFVGALLRSPHDVWQVHETVTPDCLTLGYHRDIYNAVIKLAARGTVSVTALQANLPEEYEEVGPTIAILMALKESALEAGSATDYAPFLAERSAMRRLDALSDWLKKETRKTDKTSEDISAEAGLRLNAIMMAATTQRPRAIGEIAEKVTQHANAAQMADAAEGITSGISSLDEILGALLPGDLGFVIASQADGKSALSAQIGMHAAKQGVPVLYVQMEMSPEQMGARELAKLSGMPVAQIHEGAMDAFQLDSLVAAQRTLTNVPFYVLDMEEATVRQIRAQCLSMQRNGGLGLVIIDQLDKLKPEGKYRDRFEAYKEVTRDLKRMSKGLNMPCITLAQRTRSAQRRDDPTPHVLDADIPSIERDADWIIGLWRRENFLQMNRPDHRGGEEAKARWENEIHNCRGLAEAITLKHRRRKAFRQCRMHFEGQTMKFSEGK